MTRNLAWAAPLMLMAAPAVAQQSGGDAPAPATTRAAATLPSATDAVPAAEPKRICRTFVPTGRRIANTECRSAVQWAAIDKANAEAAKRFQDHAADNAGTNLGGIIDARGVVGLP